MATCPRDPSRSRDGATVLSTATLSGGKATISAQQPATVEYYATVTATYGGPPLTTSSSSVAEVVSQAATATSTTPRRATRRSGNQSVTLRRR